MIGVFTFALLTAEFEQVWAKLGLLESYDCTIVQLETKDQLTSTIGSWTKLGFKNRVQL